MSSFLAFLMSTRKDACAILDAHHLLCYIEDMKTILCHVCQKPFQVKPYRVNTAKYCSRVCLSIAYRGQKPRYIPPTNSVTIVCPQCGKGFTRWTSRLKYGRGKYCSPKCQYTAIKARPKQGQIDLICLNCGKNFRRYKSWLRKKGNGKYCSRKCRDEHWIGKNHPLYIDGNGTNQHGSNWYAQRRKVLKRDNYMCQHCGAKDNLDVHHAIPFREYGMDEYRVANELSNLITLCSSCHRTNEAAIQRSARIS